MSLARSKIIKSINYLSSYLKIGIKLRLNE